MQGIKKKLGLRLFHVFVTDRPGVCFNVRGRNFSDVILRRKLTEINGNVYVSLSDLFVNVKMVSPDDLYWFDWLSER